MVCFDPHRFGSIFQWIPQLFLLPVAALSSCKNSSLALIGFKRLDSDYRLAGKSLRSGSVVCIASYFGLSEALHSFIGYSTGSGYSQSENQQNQSYHVAHTDHSQRMERPAQVFNHTVGSITPNSNNGYVLSSQNGGFSQPSHVQPYSALSHTSPVYTPHVMGNQFSPGQFTSGHFTSGAVMNFPPELKKMRGERELPTEELVSHGSQFFPLVVTSTQCPSSQSPVAPAGVSQPVLSYSHDGDLASPLQRVGDTPVGVSIPLPTVSADSQQPMATFSHDGDLASPLQRVGDTSVGVSIPLPTVSAHSQQPMATSSHDGDLAAVTSPIASQRSDNVAGEFVTTLNLDAGSSETHFPELCGETQRLDTSITHLRTRLQPEPTDFLEDEVQNEQVNEEFPVLNFPVEHVGRIANSSSQNSRQIIFMADSFTDRTYRIPITLKKFYVCNKLIGHLRQEVRFGRVGIEELVSRGLGLNVAIHPPHLSHCLLAGEIPRN
ncbi:hypothetical protein V6N12_019499 [Hibiscus sabdariffa]|uniref:Uncharacterized protein n=1 Tax=Hibiscus sabdariffa TaxID=183260 RepID=A0ABR2BME4_9ROSI